MAEPIPYEIVTETWQRMADTPVEQAQVVIDELEQEQPVIMVYLLALDDYPFNQTEREIIFYFGAVLWEVMKQGEGSMAMVTEEIVSKVEDENFQFLELLANDTEADFMSATRTLIDSYAEPEVLRYLVEALMEDDADLDAFEMEFTAEEEDDGSDDVLEDFTAGDAAALFEEGNGTPLNFFDAFEDENELDFEEEDEEGDEDQINIRPEYRGLAFVHLKTVLDALIQSRS
jgi:hypothetical protein